MNTKEGSETSRRNCWAWGLTALFFIILAAITFRCTWPADHVFSASDMNIGRLAFKKNSLPELLSGFFTGNQVLGSSTYAISLYHLLLTIFPLISFANIFYGAMLVIGSLSTVWFLRLWERSWLASVFGALVSFWFNSIMLAAGGHAYKLEVLAFSAISLCLVEKSVRSQMKRVSCGYAMLAGLSVGVMLLEQQDVALLAGLFVGPYALFRLVQEYGRAVARWSTTLVPIALIGVLMSAGMVLKSYRISIQQAAAVQDDAAKKWDFITQWSLVPGEWPDLIAPGWSGWSSGNPEGPYWGKIGRAAEWERSKKGFMNFKLTSNYLGVVPFLFGVLGVSFAVRNRKKKEGAVILFWCIAGVFGLWLAFGKYSLLYKLFYQLPMVNNIRAPIKFLDNFQICLGIVAAFGLDWVIAEGRRAKAVKIFSISCAVISGLLLLAGLKLLVAPSGQINEFTAMGFGQYAKVMVRNMSNAWFHATLLALICAGLMFYVWKSVKPAWWAAIALIGVLSADSLLLTSHYFKAVNIASMKKGNVLIDYLKRHQGNERTFFVDQTGIYNQWLASDGPYHGLNLFNIWQMPRMPVDYKTFLSVVGRNQIRLWQLSAIKYVAAPAQVMQRLKQNPVLGKQFEPVLNYQVPTAQGMRSDVLLKFTGSIPRFALFPGWEVLPIEQHCERLVSPAHNMETTLLVDAEAGVSASPGTGKFQPLDAKVTKKKAVLNVNVDVPAVIRFSQHYQSGWHVFVDGEPATLLRVDYLCMGVQVPAGKHTVEFRCVDASKQAIFTLGIFVIALAGGALLVLLGRNRGASKGRIS